MPRVLSLLTLLLTGSACLAQFKSPVAERHFPVNQGMPAGEISYWQAMGGRIRPGTIQPVEIQLPIQGRVSFFDRTPAQPLTRVAPAGYSLLVGKVYRFAIHALENYEGHTLYPTIELIGHLHPPPGQAHRFPIPVSFTEDELQAAMNGRLVTKVVFLEQPQLAVPVASPNKLLTSAVDADANLLAEADLRGRPMAIVRMGSRQPMTGRADPHFFGELPPVSVSPPPQQPLTPPDASSSDVVEPVTFQGAQR